MESTRTAPDSFTTFSCEPTVKAMLLLSGDQNALLAPSVPLELERVHAAEIETALLPDNHDVTSVRRDVRHTYAGGRQ